MGWAHVAWIKTSPLAITKVVQLQVYSLHFLHKLMQSIVKYSTYILMWTYFDHWSMNSMYSCVIKCLKMSFMASAPAKLLHMSRIWLGTDSAIDKQKNPARSVIWCKSFVCGGFVRSSLYNHFIHLHRPSFVNWYSDHSWHMAASHDWGIDLQQYSGQKVCPIMRGTNDNSILFRVCLW